jgi:acyl carrier protein
LDIINQTSGVKLAVFLPFEESMMGESETGVTLDQATIRASLRDYIKTSLLPAAGIESFDDGDSFLEKGIIDSTGVLELLEFIESNFRIKVEDEEVVPANLDSLDNLCAYIHRKVGR